MSLLMLLGIISVTSSALVVLLASEDRRHAAELARLRQSVASWQRSYNEVVDALQAAHEGARKDERRLRHLAEFPACPVYAYMAPADNSWPVGPDALADLRKGIDADILAAEESARRAHAQ